MHLPLTQRASEADTTFRCHGSLLLKPRVPKRKDDEGVEGAALHFEIARRAIAELGAIPPEGGLVRDPQIPADYRIPAFSAWIPGWALERIREVVPAVWSLMVELELAYRYDLPRPVWVPVSEIIGPIPEGYTVREGMVLIDHYEGTGHLDVFAISPDGTEAIGIDWKSGIVGHDEAENNWQAGQYAGLAKAAWPALGMMTFYMGQPKIDEEATGIRRWSDATLDGPQLERMNVVLAEEMCAALEDRYTTDSGPKQCRYCPVGRRCPSIIATKDHMKATITTKTLEDLKRPESEAELAEFVISGRTLMPHIDAATDALHDLIDAKGGVTSTSGVYATNTRKPGKIKVKDMLAYDKALAAMVPNMEDRLVCYAPSKGRVLDQIAKVNGIHKSSNKEMDATTMYNAHVAPHTEQSESRYLVLRT